MGAGRPREQSWASRWDGAAAHVFGERCEFFWQTQCAFQMFSTDDHNETLVYGSEIQMRLKVKRWS